jgi:prepilin-type N-terminal cleavage/methylation domain-containing protein
MSSTVNIISMTSFRRRAAHPTERPRRASFGLCRGGFTLIELVVSMSVGVIVCGIAGSLLWNASRQRAEISTRSELYDMGSAALEVMFRHVREIPQDECPSSPTPCLLGNAQVTAAGPSDLRFGSRGFRFNAINGAIEMTIDSGATWQRLAADVRSLSFSYWDRSANALTGSPLSAADRAAIRRIGVDIQLARGGQSAHLRSAVYLRSFMNEVTRVP